MEIGENTFIQTTLFIVFKEKVIITDGLLWRI